MGPREEGRVGGEGWRGERWIDGAVEGDERDGGEEGCGRDGRGRKGKRRKTKEKEMRASRNVEIEGELIAAGAHKGGAGEKSAGVGMEGGGKCLNNHATKEEGKA